MSKTYQAARPGIPTNRIQDPDNPRKTIRLFRSATEAEYKESIKKQVPCHILFGEAI